MLGGGAEERRRKASAADPGLPEGSGGPDRSQKHPRTSILDPRSAPFSADPASPERRGHGGETAVGRIPLRCVQAAPFQVPGAPVRLLWTSSWAERPPGRLPPRPPLRTQQGTTTTTKRILLEGPSGKNTPTSTLTL